MFLKSTRIVLLVLIIALPAALPWDPHYSSHEQKQDIAILHRILHENPEDTSALKHLARIYFLNEKFTKAEIMAQRCLKKIKDRDMAYIKILCRANRGHYRKAIEYANVFMKEYPINYSDRRLLLEKKKLFKRALATRSAPVARALTGSRHNRIILGLDFNHNRLVGYDRTDKRIFYYNYQRKKIIFPEKIPSYLDGISPEDLRFISFSGNGLEVLLSLCIGKDAAEILYRRYNPLTKEWSFPHFIATLNVGKRNTYGNFTADGKAILFSSSNGKKRGYNLCIIKKNKYREWGTPEEIRHCNTNGDEYSLFLHPDGETLYFSTNGRPGLGGFDLFAARLSLTEESSSVSSIVNLMTLNSYRNETQPLIVPPGENNGYYTFTKAGHNTPCRVIKLQRPPSRVTILTGRLNNKKTGKPITDSEIRLMRIGKKELWGGYLINTDTAGRFSIPAKSDSRYILSVAAPGYLYYSENVGPLGNRKKHYRKINLREGKIAKGYSFQAKNIYFNTGSAVIRQKSKAELHNIYNLLIKNPGIRITIAGYTDSVGDEKYNLRLSKKRAQAIARYIIKKGISEYRLKTRGYGEGFSAASNITDAGRQKNRRVEIIITKSSF